MEPKFGLPEAVAFFLGFIKAANHGRCESKAVAYYSIGALMCAESFSL